MRKQWMITVFLLIVMFVSMCTILGCTKHGVLSPYRKLRNTIAHSHYILHEDQVKMVEWIRDADLGFVPTNLLDFDLDGIILEMKYLCVIISQISALNQLMRQSKELWEQKSVQAKE